MALTTAFKKSTRFRRNKMAQRKHKKRTSHLSKPLKRAVKKLIKGNTETKYVAESGTKATFGGLFNSQIYPVTTGANDLYRDG